MILYEDNHLLALDKPAGLLTQPSGTELPSLEGYGKSLIKERDQKPGGVFLEAVHRLDRPASGIVLFAKSQKALSRLQKIFRERKVEKYYLALVEGHPPKKAKLLHALLKQGQRSIVVDAGIPGAKSASLSFRLIKRHPPFSLLEIQLETGRYHQIRAQLAAIGCPIVGDQKYGSTIEREGIALHHFRLGFPHPVSGAWLEVESPAPF